MNLRVLDTHPIRSNNGKNTNRKKCRAINKLVLVVSTLVSLDRSLRFKCALP